MQELIAKIQERAHDPDLATDEGHDICDRKGNPIPYVANPPLSEQEVADWERETGFRLPALLRALYTQVGDGGFGPGYGLYRLKDCHAFSSEILPGGEEKTRYLEICTWGCAITSFIDCDQPDVPVLRADPNQETEIINPDTGVSEIRYGVICLEYDSLAGWLEAWVSGQELFYAAYGLDPAEFEDEV